MTRFVELAANYWVDIDEIALVRLLDGGYEFLMKSGIKNVIQLPYGKECLQEQFKNLIERLPLCYRDKFRYDKSVL